MSITATSKYPFFKLEKRDLLEYRLTLLYPHTFVNKDSIVTKIVFYLYDVAFPSKEVVETANENPEQREIFARSLDYTQKRFDFLTQNFDTKRNIDSQFLLYLPNISQGDDYNRLEKTISDNLTSKYGKSSNIMTGGNEYNPNDNSFFKVQIWKTDKLNIKLVRKRYPVVNPQTSRNFYMVLIYEYNEEIRDKYKLKSETNLANTF